MIRLLGLLLFAPLVGGAAQADEPALSALFERQQMAGTMVIASLDGRRVFIHDEARAGRRFPVASTFKILNSLIALEEHAVGEDEVLKWDGRVHDFPDWNRDQTLASAFRVSCVWCYQDLAGRIGGDTYRRYLAAIGFGALREPFDPTAFWLDGALTISAREQVDFLRRLYQRSLPFRADSYDALARIMLVRQTPAYALRAKTGWAARSTPQVGWYVGYLETPGGVWLFAMNLDVRGPDDLPLRQQLTWQAFETLGLVALPEGSD